MAAARHLFLFLAVGGVLAPALPVVADSGSAPSGIIRIGVSTAITGQGAAYGADVKNGIEFANEKFGRGRFELVVEDDRCAGREAVSAAHKLVQVDRAKYIIGYPCSGAILAAAPIFEKAKVVTVGTACSAPAISAAGEYIFRTWPSDAAAAVLLAQYIGKSFASVGMISEETDFSQGIARPFAQESKRSGLRVLEETFLIGTTDFRAILSRLKAAGVKALFLNPQSEVALIPLYRQVREMQLGLPVFTNYNGSSPAFLEAFGAAADGVVFFDAPFLEQLANKEGELLYQEFVKRYGEAKSSSRYVLTSIAGFAALAEAIASGEDVRAYLHAHKFSHVIDDLAFDRQGDPVGIGFALKVVQHGKVVPLP